MSQDPALVQALVNALEIHEKSCLASWGKTLLDAHASSCNFCWALRAWRAGVPLELGPLQLVPKEQRERWQNACHGCGSAQVWRWNGRWSFDVDPFSEERGPEIRWCPFCGTRLEPKPEEGI